MNFSLFAVILNVSFSICSAMPNMDAVREIFLQKLLTFLQSNVLADTGFDDINWYKRDASTSAMLANAKMIGNDGHPLPTFADSLGKILEALGF